MPSFPRRRATDAANNGKNVTLYVVAVLVLAVFAMASVVAVSIFRPEKDNTSLIASILTFIGPAILALIALIQRENHNTLNSRLDQMVDSRTEIAETRGILRGASLPVAPEDARKIADAVEPERRA